MSAEPTGRRIATKAAAEPVRRGLPYVGLGLTGICFMLGFSLTTVLARVSHGDEQALGLVSAQTLAGESHPVANAWIEGFEFSPLRVKVSTGTTVLWTNRDGVDHDVTFPEGDVASPLVGQGGEIAVVFREPGEYRYYCHVHPFMQGTVIVE
ncbi:MAG: plastocyanin/azurin family copper-binding protein [Gammaproteobacteria bacterium]